MKYILLFALLVPVAVFSQEIQSVSDADVWIQDQVTPPFHMFFMTEDKTDITLAAIASVDDTAITVSAGHGITTADHIIINYGPYTQQTGIEAVVDNVVSIESPIFAELPIGTQVVRGRTEMNVDGSVTPVTYYCRPYTTEPVDVINFHIFIEDNVEGDDSKFGGGTALTNGVYVQLVDGMKFGLGLYKDNFDFQKYGSKIEDPYTSKAGGGNYSMNFPISLKDAYGVVLRLDPDEGAYIKMVIHDDLTGLLSFVVTALGQTTSGE